MSGRSRYRRDRSRDRKGAIMSARNNAITNAVTGTYAKESAFTPEDFAIYRHVWNLSREQSGRLDRYFLLKSGIDTFLQTVDQNHAFKDMLCIGDIHYEIEYMECSYTHLCDNVARDKMLIISFRRNVANHLAVAIIRIMRSGTEGAFSKTSNLV